MYLENAINLLSDTTIEWSKKLQHFSSVKCLKTQKKNKIKNKHTSS